MSFDKNTPATRRIESLLDDNSFVELMSNVTSRSTDFNLDSAETPSDGVITGHGLIDGNLVYVYCQDSSVLGGTIGEMHAKKIKNIYDLAIKTGAPVISILDSNGIRLQESFDALEALGTIYSAASHALGIVLTISCVTGNCGGGLSVLAGLSDFSFITEDANLFLNSPDAIPGNNIELNNTAKSDFASSISGVSEAVSSEDEMFEKVRSLVSILPGSYDEGYRTEEIEDDLNRASEVDDYLSNTVEFIKEIVDDNEFVEVKNEYGKSMVTGLARLSGTTIGVVANDFSDDSVLTTDGIKKASSFVRFLDAFDIPLLTLTNVKGFDRTLETEASLVGELAHFTSTLSEADVPKVNLIVKNAFGSAYVLMNSKSVGADIVFAYDDAEMGIMDSDKAAMIICPDGTVEEREAVREEFEAKSQGINNALRRGYIDRVIEHIDTRKYLISAFEMLFSKRESDIVKKHSSK